MNTSNPRPSPFGPVTVDALAAAKAAIEALGPPPPRVGLHAAPMAGKGWVAVLVDDRLEMLLSPEQFAQVKAKLGAVGAR